MNRINTTLAQLAENGQKALVPYVVSGDPDLGITLSVLHGLVEAGADILELGVPFSDPMAEGPVIQKAHERALENNTSLRDTLALVKDFRTSNQQTPVVLMGYTNPIERMGYENFSIVAKEAGVDGVLTVDLPPEESGEFSVYLKQHEIENIFLIAPTTTNDRIKLITSMASGYLYYVSLKGVTGAGHLDIDSVEKKMAEIRSLTELPVCVGFGIKDPASAVAVCEVSDGAVVGSVLVNKMAELSTAGEKSAERITQEVSAIIGEMRAAINNTALNNTALNNNGHQ